MVITFEGKAMGGNPFRFFTTSIYSIEWDINDSKRNVAPRVVPRQLKIFNEYFGLVGVCLCFFVEISSLWTLLVFRKLAWLKKKHVFDIGTNVLKGNRHPSFILFIVKKTKYKNLEGRFLPFCGPYISLEKGSENLKSMTTYASLIGMYPFRQFLKFSPSHSWETRVDSLKFADFQQKIIFSKSCSVFLEKYQLVR